MSFRKFLDQSFERFQKLPAPQAQPAWERLLDRRRDNLGGVFEGAEFAADKPSLSIRRPLWAAAAAALVSAVVLSIAYWPAAPGALEIAARKVHFGEPVRSQIFGEVVKLEDGSRIEMKANSELVLERADDGVRIHLNSGEIIVNAARQHGHLYVQTKDVTVSVVGTVFYVKAERVGSRVAVFEGEVHVMQGQKEMKLGPGEQVTSNPKMEPIPVKEQVAWSREAVTHIALLPQAPTPGERAAFEVATIRPAARVSEPAPPGARGGGGNRGPCSGGIQLDPRRFSGKGLSLGELIGFAYGRCADFMYGGSLSRLSGGPDWLKSERWDIEALIPEGSVDPLPLHPYFGDAVTQLIEGGSPKVQGMIRTLLQERFKLVVRTEMRHVPAYALTVMPGGPKFQGNSFDYGIWVTPPPPRASGPDAPKVITAAEGAEYSGGNVGGPCRWPTGEMCAWDAYLNLTLDRIADGLSGGAGRRVIDRTGISEKVSFRIEWPAIPNPPAERGPRFSRQTDFRTFQKALEAVGLQLKDEPNWEEEFYVIERAEKPSEN